MSAVTVLGAGVVGQVYAGLLSEAGHEVTVVARGRHAEQLHARGVVLEREGRTQRPGCRIVTGLAAARPVQTLVVAVRGDQLSSVQAEVAASAAPAVVCMATPLDQRAGFERQVGTDRTVFAFSGIGGSIGEEGIVRYHIVRQQPTTVDVATVRGQEVAEVFASTGLPVRREERMPAWLDTHAVFIAGIGSTVLAGGGADSVARSPARVREMVVALGEAFDALEEAGTPVRPPALRTIFGRVPWWLATRYWQRQLAGPMVRTSIEPHVRSTRDSEFASTVDFARSLVGPGAPRYQHLLDGARSPGQT